MSLAGIITLNFPFPPNRIKWQVSVCVVISSVLNASRCTLFGICGRISRGWSRRSKGPGQHRSWLSSVIHVYQEYRAIITPVHDEKMRQAPQKQRRRIQTKTFCVDIPPVCDRPLLMRPHIPKGIHWLASRNNKMTHTWIHTPRYAAVLRVPYRFILHHHHAHKFGTCVWTCSVSCLCPQESLRRVLSFTVSLSPKRLARTYASHAATVFEITRCCEKKKKPIRTQRAQRKKSQNRNRVR